jgi:hypothetical protein
MLTCTVGTAIKLAVAHFHAVANDLASTVRTAGSHGMDRALKAIERTTLASLNDLKGLVILVAADITFSHSLSFLTIANPAKIFNPLQGY